MTNCKGCLVKCTHYTAYNSGHISRTVLTKCPCGVCIIKMVCEANRCEEFDIYINTAVRELEEI